MIMCSHNEYLTMVCLNDKKKKEKNGFSYKMLPVVERNPREGAAVCDLDYKFRI